MFIKKALCVFVCVLMFLNFFSSVSAFAGEEETSFVEFKALYSDDLVDPVEIKLTEKNSGYVYNYYLYRINNYFTNVSVPLGSYSVKVTVPNVDTNKLNYIYESDFMVEPSSVALEFVVIIDNMYTDAYVEEDTITSSIDSWFNSEEQGSDLSNNYFENTSNETSSFDSSDIELSQDNNKNNTNEITNNKSSRKSLVVSFCVSAFAIIVAAGVAWFIKKRS